MPMRAALAEGRAITLADIRAAAGRISGAVLRTPTLDSQAVSRATGARVFLKLDNLQATGAFKERGAANRLALLSARERAAGVIAMSAGNHAQAVARHASLAGIAATSVMPKFTPATKVTRTEAWGARVVLHGTTLAEAAAHAHALAAAEGLVFIHPYDDAAVIAGQGTATLEMLEDAPAIEALVIPVGGGGLCAGAAIAAADPHGPAAHLVDAINDLLVDPADQHHFDHIHGLGGGDPQAVAEFGLDLQPAQPFVDFRSATVHYHHLDADAGQQGQVAEDGLAQVVAHHGGAAVLDHDSPAGKALDVGQGLTQHRDPQGVGGGDGGIGAQGETGWGRGFGAGPGAGWGGAVGRVG
jgi:cysteine synthase